MKQLLVFILIQSIALGTSMPILPSVAKADVIFLSRKKVKDYRCKKKHLAYGKTLSSLENWDGYDPKWYRPCLERSKAFSFSTAFREQEKKFLKGFKLYLNATLMEGYVWTKEVIECLEQDISSSFCSNIKNKIIPRLIQSYMNMRQDLAVAKGSNYSFTQKDVDKNEKLCKNISECKGAVQKFALQEQIKQPFNEFRLLKLRSLFGSHDQNQTDPIPKLAEISPQESEISYEKFYCKKRTLIHDFFNEMELKYQGMPPPSDAVLDWPERSLRPLMENYSNFKAALNTLEVVDPVKRALEYIEANTTYEELKKLLMKKAQANQFLKTRGFGKKYMESYLAHINKWPVLAYLELPRLNEIEFEDYELPNRSKGAFEYDKTCEPFIRGIAIRSFNKKNIYTAFAKAFRSIHKANISIRKQLKEDYQATTQAKDWLSLMAFRPLLREYSSIQLKDEKGAPIGLSPESKLLISEQLFDEFDGIELKNDLLIAGGSIILGLGCTFVVGALTEGIGTLGALALCAIGSGIAVNIGFTAITHNRYERTFNEIFAAPGGEFLFQEIDKLNDRDAEIMFEMMFFFMGTGAKEAGRFAKGLLKGFKKAEH